MKENEYQCAACDEVFEKGWTDEEALAESEEKFAMPVTQETHAVICDDCYNKMFNN